VYDTFQESCEEHGLLDDDHEWELAIEEAASNYLPKIVHNVFAYILAYSNPASPAKLFVKYQEFLYADFKHEIPYISAAIAAQWQTEIQYYLLQHLLIELKKLLADLNTDIEDILGLPHIEQNENHDSSMTGESDLSSALSSDAQPVCPVQSTAEQNIEHWKQEYHYNMAKVNDKQCLIINKVTEALSDPNYNGSKLFGLIATAGCGKMMCAETILAFHRVHTGTVHLSLATSSTAISAQLYKGGCMSHSTFKISLSSYGDVGTKCNVSMQSEIGHKLSLVELIVWDEIFGLSHYCIEAVDRLF
jgi:hypothetical protein